MPGINFYELTILVVLALVLLGPERLPLYAQNLTRWARKTRSMGEVAKVRFKEETGADFDDIDWQKYDPRQYDPRRIIREALAEDYEGVRSDVRSLEKQLDPRELFAPADSAAADHSARSGGALVAGIAGAESSLPLQDARALSRNTDRTRRPRLDLPNGASEESG